MNTNKYKGFSIFTNENIEKRGKFGYDAMKGKALKRNEEPVVITD